MLVCVCLDQWQCMIGLQRCLPILTLQAGTSYFTDLTFSGVYFLNRWSVCMVIYYCFHFFLQQTACFHCSVQHYAAYLFLKMTVPLWLKVYFAWMWDIVPSAPFTEYVRCGWNATSAFWYVINRCCKRCLLLLCSNLAVGHLIYVFCQLIWTSLTWLLSDTVTCTSYRFVCFMVYILIQYNTIQSKFV